MARGAALSLLLAILFLALACRGPGPSLTPSRVPPTPTPLPLAATEAPPAPTPPPPSATPAPPQGQLIVVSNAADRGPGTLREALRSARAGDTITFDPAVFPPQDPVTIFLSAEDEDSALPTLTQGHLTVDASNAGVILDGSRIPGDWVNGLEIYSSGNTIRGLQIVNFSGSGLALCGGSHNTIGGDRGLGSGPVGKGVLSSHNAIGIDLCSQESFATLVGNLLGTDPTGALDWGNRSSGLCLERDVHDTVVGPGNVIAYNKAEGIRVIGPRAFANTITRNSIHHNGRAGITLDRGGSPEVAIPFISSWDLDAGTVMGEACASCAVEIFSGSGDQGEVYEGRVVADGSGAFAFDKGAPFTARRLLATATDVQGNTGEFSAATPGSNASPVLQEGNRPRRTRLRPQRSGALEDNRIGALAGSLWHLEPEVFPDSTLDANHILDLGLKRLRFTINNLDAEKVDWSVPETSIDPRHDAFITTLARNGIALTYVLLYWDIPYKDAGGEIRAPRFKSEEEVQRYLDYVRFIVRHFKDRIQYYEIWNEPNIPGRLQSVEVEDYLSLVRRAAPVIRQEYPQARIVVGGTSSLINPASRAYLFQVLGSDVMPLVDVVSWHPMYGSSPEYDDHREYWYRYPATVAEIKDVASAHGFRGEFVADELHWNTPDLEEPGWPTYSEGKCAKYLARSIVVHLGLDVAVTQVLLPAKPRLFRTNQDLCTVLAGARPATVPLQVQSAATGVVSYGFALPNGDRLLAVWRDGAAVEEDPGVAATLTFPGLSASGVTAIDPLDGYEQQLIMSDADGCVVVRNLLVRDYPLILRLAAPPSP